jgi:sRNA-binding protein
MTKKILALVILSLSLAACEPAGTDNNTNANSNVRPNNPPASTPAPASPEVSPAVRSQLKAGDKVKVTINGSATDATVISVDEKSGKARVTVAGQKEEKTVAIADVIKN